MDAFRHCIEHGLSAVNIVVDYGTDRVPLIIPVGSNEAVSPHPGGAFQS